MSKNYEMYKAPSLPKTAADKRALALRLAQMMTAQHNFVVDVSLGSSNANADEGNKKIANAVLELVAATKAIYPYGPDQLRADIVGIGLLVDVDVLTLAIEKAANLPTEMN